MKALRGERYRVGKYYLTQRQYLKLLDYANRTRKPIGYQISDMEIERITGAEKHD